MQASLERKQFAWQPLTPGGVAAFASARLGRLLLVQFIFALLAAPAVVWFLYTAWFPVITEAISQLPPAGQLRSSTLDWRGPSPEVLAANHFLALVVDLRHEGHARSPAHLAIEFGQRDVKVFSLLGFLALPYPQHYRIAFNRVELTPWWGAWSPAILALAAGSLVLALMLSWAALASLYSLPVWLVGLYGNRNLNLRASWRLAGAALMPGALLMSATICFYGLHALDLVHVLGAATLHLVLGWAYLLLSPFWCPRHPAAAPRANPFLKPAA